MIKQVYSIYDAKAENYSPTFTASNNADAVRAFERDVNSDNPQSMLCSNPEDFTLFHLGSWDSESGVYNMSEAKTSLGLGLDYIKKDIQ